ncbi:hypothetical protein H9L39_08867, partial [Fusarium oxysporum f. sp. albedinis]
PKNDVDYRRLLLTGDNLVPCNSVNIDDYHCVTIAEFERFGQGAEARSGAAEAKPPKRGLTRILRNPCTNPGFQAASRSKSGDRADVP